MRRPLRRAVSLAAALLVLPAPPVSPAAADGAPPGSPPSAGAPETWCGVNDVEALGSGAAAAPHTAAAPVCFGCSEATSYRAFDGTVYPLTRYTGRFTELLLPSGWIDGAGLDDAARRLLLERADFVYQHASELMGGEPAGDGPLSLAIVDTTCGYGCGNVGSKGVEVVSTDVARSEIRSDLAAGVLPRILVHEMAHNFDLLNRNLWAGAPSTFDYHAWTSFFEQYLEIYTRMGSATASPDDVQENWVDSTFGAYLRNPDASWERCIAETACGDEPGTADRTWGGVTHRFVQLHGPHAARRFLAALPQLRALHGPPQTLQDKADLHFEALSQASGTDLGCYADAWRWSISPALRARMAALPPEPRCIDLDGDGMSPLLGDCDDDDPTVHPGATEIANGRDDDCNGVVDDLLVTEASAGDFGGATFPFPGRAIGSIVAGDSDDFWLDIPGSGSVAFELCSQGFQGWLFVYDGNQWLGYQYTANGQCSRKTYLLTKGRWRVSIELNTSSTPGAYTLAAAPGSPWPAALPSTPAPEEDSCRLILKAGTADRARFWIAGTGFVAETQSGGPARTAFYPEGGASASYSLRAQPFEAEVPVADWSAARSVSYAPAPGAACEDDPDNDGVPTGRDVCPLVSDPTQVDTDGDGVGDACDDCITEADGPLAPDAGGVWQRDSNHDGFGNVCDADLDGDGVVNFRDLALLKSVFLRANADADFDGDGIVNFRDLAKLKSRLFRAPGPSALAR